MSRRTPSSYHVRAVLTEGGLWQAEVDELPEVRPAHRSLSRLEARLRRSIGEGEGVDPDALTLHITTSTGDATFDAEISRVSELRRKADRLAEEARTAAVPVARRLVRTRGVSVRDAGSLLGYSGGAISVMTQDN